MKQILLLALMAVSVLACEPKDNNQGKSCEKQKCEKSSCDKKDCNMKGDEKSCGDKKCCDMKGDKKGCNMKEDGKSCGDKKSCDMKGAKKGCEYIKSEAPDSDLKMAKAYNFPSMNSDAKVQSPINILTKDIPATKSMLNLNFDEKIIKIENLGHTVQVDFASGSTINLKGVVYNAKQLHFHTPSEHLVNGITYPMEAHLVCTIADTSLIAKGSKQYLVLGYFFQMGSESQFIKEFINQIPDETTKVADVKVGEVKLTDLFGGKKDLHYYKYDGSLTTPPFTESVSWHVCSTIMDASPEQIKSINKLMGNNARHIQDTNGRGVSIE